MNVLLILGAMPVNSPYLNYYTKFLEQKGISYDICAWNRYENKYTTQSNLFVFDSKGRSGRVKKVFDYFRYRNYLLRHINSHNYERIIVFTITTAIFLTKTLTQNFNKKYIFDIRDYSSLLRLRFINKKLKRLLSMSYVNVISSPGFKHWLPAENEYIISHNTASDIFVGEGYKAGLNNKIIILTIGALRDANSNIALINFLGNNNQFLLQFSGKGSATSIIQEYVNIHKLNNVLVTGEYKKEDESSIVSKVDMINILLPHNMISDYLMSNRFYLSVTHGKPMIVNSKCTQADFVKQYNLGVIIDENDNITEKIKDYWIHFDKKQYENGCAEFLQIVRSDEMKFNKTLDNFIK